MSQSGCWSAKLLSGGGGKKIKKKRLLIGDKRVKSGKMMN
jgi:hypothetical protein